MKNQAEIVNSFSADVASYQQAIGLKLSNLITIISMLMISIGVALYLGWILTLIVLATIPLIGFGWYKNVFYRRLIRK